MPGFLAYWLGVIRGYLGDMDMMGGVWWGCGWGSGIGGWVFCGGWWLFFIRVLSTSAVFFFGVVVEVAECFEAV